jgi:Rieske Fe-S protein
MQRRDFLNGACRICLLGAAGASVIDMFSCSPATGNAIATSEAVNNKVTIPLSVFEKGPIQVISPKKYPYEVALKKEQDGTYKALLLKCTHFDNQIVQSNDGFTCHFHGSHFDKEGNVTKGPASEPLTQLKTTINNTDIIIQLI